MPDRNGNDLKFSIVCCAYGNHYQFGNFLFTAAKQEHDSFEIVVADNATPSAELLKECLKHPMVQYIRISERAKRCTNITQGINLAAKMASGKYLVIVADSNVLLAFNLLASIDALIDEEAIVLSAGVGIDVKISPGGTWDSEYYQCDEADAICQKLLADMGWPDDPLNLKLLPGRYRMPPPHFRYDCYIVALDRQRFLDRGGYDESCTEWGPYHENLVSNWTKMFTEKRLKGTRVIHQFHSRL